MNPTFNLSAAEAPLPMLPASRSAEAAARSVFFIVNLQTIRGERQSRTRRPIAHDLDTKSAVGYEHGSQRGGRGRAAGACPREKHQNDDGREIGQRRHELRWNSDTRALRVQLKDCYGAEQIRD